MIDFETLRLTGRPNAVLLAPPGLCREAKPHGPAPYFEALSPGKLLDAWRDVVLAAPRTTLVEEDRDRLQIEATQRSAILGFVDDISARAISAPGGATLAIYSRSRVGHSDLGVNRKRIDAWLRALSTRVAAPKA